MRDRLIELIKQGTNETPCKDNENVDCTGMKCSICEINGIADHLIANGVIVPPVSVGQTIYTKYGYSFKIEKIEILKDKKIIFRCGNDGTDDYMAFYDFEIGTEVFLSREDAEAALSGESEVDMLANENDRM